MEVCSEDPTIEEIIACVDRLNKTTSKVDALNKVFSTIVNRKNVQLTMITAVHIFKHNLNVDIDTLIKEKMYLFMPLMKALIYYISSWSGWSKSKSYYTNNLPYKKWYKEFKDFLHEKIHYLYDNYEQYLVTQDSNAIQQTSTDSAKTHYILQLFTNKDNFNCVIQNDDLIFAQLSNTTMPVVDFAGLLNLPYVAVEVQLPNIHISRKCVHEINKYITATKPSWNIKTGNDNACADVLPIDNDKTTETACEFSKLKHCFNNILTKCESVEINSSKLETIFSQFLLDLNNCMNVNVELPINLFFTYNVGNCSFLKKTEHYSAREQTRVYIVEEITPKIQFGLHFIDIDDLTGNSIINAANIRTVLEECFKISCTLCKLTFVGNSSSTEALAHFKLTHPFDGKIECDKCKKLITYYAFSKLRWFHKCNL